MCSLQGLLDGAQIRLHGVSDQSYTDSAVTAYADGPGSNELPVWPARLPLTEEQKKHDSLRPPLVK